MGYWVRLSAGEHDAGDMLEIVVEDNILPAGQKRCDIFALAVAELQRQQPLRDKGRAGLRDQAAVDV